MKKIVAIVLLLGLTGYGIWQALAAEQQNRKAGLAVGDIAYDFALKTPEGQQIRLSDLRGKPVIINFWATWCPPCQKEMPDIEKFYKQYKDDVELLSVHLTSQDRRENLSPFMKKYGLTFPIVMDEKGEVLKLYNIQTIPTTYIIDGQGVIRKKVIGPMTYKQMQDIISRLP
ncbi:thioredoxin family protein [Anoxybacillus sp. B7M1]|uniref:TlpA disulfide reductase family protein n=1 Tax=unclassified Anoxybacillus TaxID=2639704 RepID=UPI0005CCC3DF|nr:MULTISPECIES: TlpA disulfide reductase family protein [unclassified Anoxybacillus]ANB57917.1 thioredoxin family protein [Anoxybacillus sp. B2M1]ANB66072.1 thioredoxin family protein [Anoxybacillus sp. B7M1]